MKMDAGMDTGPVLAQVKTRLTPGITAGELSGRLAVLGADLLIAVLPAYLAGDLQPVAQDNDQAEYARLLKKEDGLLDCNLPAENLVRQVCAFNPWPGAYIIWHNQPLKVHSAHTASPVENLEPGRRTVYARLPAVSTASGLLVLDQVQPAGKKAMPGSVFLNGAAGWL